MYCRKCMSESKGNSKDEIKVNMRVETEEQCYICPKCGHIVEWVKEEENIR